MTALAVVPQLSSTLVFVCFCFETGSHWPTTHHIGWVGSPVSLGIFLFSSPQPWVTSSYHHACYSHWVLKIKLSSSRFRGLGLHLLSYQGGLLERQQTGLSLTFPSLTWRAAPGPQDARGHCDGSQVPLSSPRGILKWALLKGIPTCCPRVCYLRAYTQMSPSVA